MGFELWMNPDEWRNRVRSSAASGRPVDVTDVTSALRPIRAPFPLEAPPVRVVALSDSFCVGGQRVAVGESYSVPAGTAAALEWTGKARRA
jgi:hypothetical protein